METPPFLAARIPGEPEWKVAQLFPPRGEWTAEDYWSLPENRCAELANGCLDFLPAVTETHHLVLGYLYRAVAEFVRLRGLGVVVLLGLPIQLGSDHFRLPDVAFMHRDHTHRRQAQYWESADLAIEVVSPGGRKRDIDIKRGDYARAGIPEYWIVDPELQESQVLVLENSKYRVHGAFGVGAEASSVVLPGFGVSGDAVFRSVEKPF